MGEGDANLQTNMGNESEVVAFEVEVVEAFLFLER